ncbi:Phage tail protein (plasmid) [Streptomyces sp. YIM 121038]|uniref:phage tail protein n=1 Tax=Streptomyces sp. YIM 121038 TaxID=2136401 RepID=UPI0011103DED|nr:phage tail protein [Streptomyces sp. YIM 121038]QCX82333.1 Phage tail protein [Streptomyces sp. YIM 121038]
MTDQPDLPSPSTRPALPSVLARDPMMRQFAEAVGRLLEPFHSALADLPRVLDPWRTDTPWLSWLAQVCDAPRLSPWGEGPQRAAIASAMALATERGTPAALRHHAALLGWELSVSDPGWVKTARELAEELTHGVPAHAGVTVALAWPPSEALDHYTARGQLRAVAEANCPAAIPFTTLLADGDAPTAALTLPARFQSVSGGARTVFFYRPGVEPGGLAQSNTAVDPTVGYDLTARRPVPGPSRLEHRWKGLGPTAFSSFLQGSIDAAAYSADRNCFLLVSGAQVAHWDGTGHAFTCVYSLGTVLPQWGTAVVDDILSVPTGEHKGLYVFSKNTYRHYPSAFEAPSTAAKDVNQLYAELPSEFHQGFDAVVEDPEREGVHYLLAGPRCAEIHQFRYVQTHFIHELWPGLPIRTSTPQRGGGAIIVSDLVTINQPLPVSYYSRTYSQGGEISLYAAPAVEYDNRRTLAAPLHQVEASNSSGSVTIAKEKISTPGVYTLYYGDPAFGAWFANPAEFTALLPANSRDTGKVAPDGTPVSGQAIGFTWRVKKEWQQGAAVVLYQGNGPQEQTPGAQASALAPLPLLAPGTQETGSVTAAVPGLPPGDWTACLVARGHAAWLATPNHFTVTLQNSDYGTLSLTNATAGSLPAHSAPLFRLTQPSNPHHQRPDGRLHIYPGQDIPSPDTLPTGIRAVWTEPVSSTTANYPASAQPPGGYTAYWTAGSSTAWLAPPVRFTVAMDPARPGSLSLNPIQGSATKVTYATPYDPAGKNIVAVFEHTPGTSNNKPLINTNRETWGAKAFKDAPNKTGTLNLSGDEFKTPGDYCVYFTGSSGGNLADPQYFHAMLSPLPEGIQITKPNDITDAANAQISFTTNFPHLKNYYCIRQGDLSPEGKEIEKEYLGNNSPVTLSHTYAPGKYTVYFFARNSPVAQLAAPKTFLVNAAVTEKDYIRLPASPPTYGDDIQIEYASRFGGNPEGYSSSDNLMTIWQNGVMKSSAKAPAAHSTVTLQGNLPPGEYQVKLMGKGGSQLAAASTPLKIVARTITFYIADQSYDAWSATQSLTNCTGTVHDIPLKASGSEYTRVQYSQGSQAIPMSGSMAFTPPDPGQGTLTIRWEMANDGSVTYSLDRNAASPLSAVFLTTSNGSGISNPASALKYPAGQSGGGPQATLYLHLRNEKHRSISLTYQNGLASSLAVTVPGTAVNATLDGKPSTSVAANSTSQKYLWTVTASSQESSATANCTFTHPETQKLTSLTLTWASPAYPGKPSYTITSPSGEILQLTGLSSLPAAGKYIITNVAFPNRAIDQADSNANPGSRTISYRRGTGENQRWTIEAKSGSLYSIKSGLAGTAYLSLDGADPSKITVQSTLTLWSIEPCGDDVYRLLHPKGGVLTLPADNDGQLTLATWENQNQQKWKFNTP